MLCGTVTLSYGLSSPSVRYVSRNDLSTRTLGRPCQGCRPLIPWARRQALAGRSLHQRNCKRFCARWRALFREDCCPMAACSRCSPSVSEAQRRLERSRELSIRRRVPEVPVWRIERPAKNSRVCRSSTDRRRTARRPCARTGFTRPNSTKNNAVHDGIAWRVGNRRPTRSGLFTTRTGRARPSLLRRDTLAGRGSGPRAP